MKNLKKKINDIGELDVGGRTKLFTNDIAYFEADLNYTIIHLIIGKSKIVATTLGHIQDRIQNKYTFVRPNRKYLVNIEYINSFSFEKMLLNNDLNINISRRRQANVKPIIDYYLNNRIR